MEPLPLLPACDGVGDAMSGPPGAVGLGPMVDVTRVAMVEEIELTAWVALVTAVESVGAPGAWRRWRSSTARATTSATLYAAAIVMVGLDADDDAFFRVEQGNVVRRRWRYYRGSEHMERGFVVDYRGLVNSIRSVG